MSMEPGLVGSADSADALVRRLTALDRAYGPFQSLCCLLVRIAFEVAEDYRNAIAIG